MLCMRSKVVLLPTADGVHPWSMGMKLEADAMKKLLDDTHTRRCVWLQERWPVTSRREVEFNLKKVSRQDEGSNLTLSTDPSLHPIQSTINDEQEVLFVSCIYGALLRESTR
jgi:hypothetical protein